MGKRIALLVLAGLAGCGDGDARPPAERADRPADPPPGWRTVRNRPAGFTVSAPRSWAVRTKRAATLIRSKDRLVVITVAADRTPPGRELEPGAYARRTLEALPGFEGSVNPDAPPVRGTPYETARVDGTGSVRTSKRPQRITVVTFHRPDQVTYAAIGFRNPRVDPRFDEPAVRRVLRSFRAQPPTRR